MFKAIREWLNLTPAVLYEPPHARQARQSGKIFDKRLERAKLIKKIADSHLNDPRRKLWNAKLKKVTTEELSILANLSKGQ